MEFNYLGVNITSSGNLAKEIKTQTRKAATVAGCVKDLIWRNKHVRKERELCIYILATRPGFARVVEHILDTNMSIVGGHQFDASNMWIRFTTLLQVF